MVEKVITYLFVICLLGNLNPQRADAQVTYIRKFIDFSDSVNLVKTPFLTDNLATILVDGYLKGKLQGYKFEVGQEVLKRGPVPESVFEPWSAKKDYFIDDMVRFEGTTYIARKECYRSKPTDAGDCWEKVTYQGEPISTRYFFPTIADTLSEGGFLAGMVVEPPELLYRWQPDMEYYIEDAVSYDGRSYICIADNTGQVPSDFSEYWAQSTRGSAQFYSLVDLKGLDILYAVEPGKTPVPQMISPLVYDFNLSFLRSVGLSFYYDDAINYLASIDLPLVYATIDGYFMFQEMVEEYDHRKLFLQSLKEKLITKEIRPKKKSIQDQGRYSAFISDTTRVIDTERWKVMQSLNNELILSEGVYNDEGVTLVYPFMKLSAEAYKSLIAKSTMPLKTAKQLLMSDEFNFFNIDTTRYDSLPKRVNDIRNQTPLLNSYFYERYRVKLDFGKVTPELSPRALWAVIDRALSNQKIKARDPFVTFYDGEHDWSNVSIEIASRTWTFDKAFNLGPTRIYDYREIAGAKRFGELSVTYKRSVGGGAGTDGDQFEPIEIGFGLTYEDANAFQTRNNLAISWPELKKIFQNESAPEFRSFIESVERGSLNFFDCELVYGLMITK